MEILWASNVIRHAPYRPPSITYLTEHLGYQDGAALWPKLRYVGAEKSVFSWIFFNRGKER
jgi:hypothetical protein